jgi:CubicO group peptidase (beta-lactamase class C family)
MLASLTFLLRSRCRYGEAAAYLGRSASGPRVACPDFIDYAFHQVSLDNDPGTSYAYSNLGYCVLGEIVAVLASTSHEDAVRELLLDPAGIPASEFYVGKSLLSDIPSHETEYTCTSTDTPGDNRLCTDLVYPISVFPEVAFVPLPYGASSTETMDSHGGWVVSPRAMLQLMGAVFPEHCGR